MSIFKINSNYNSIKSKPKLAILMDKKIAYVWQSNKIDSSGYGISMRVLSEEGEMISNETIVNTYQLKDQLNPQINTLLNGNFIIAWQSDGVDTDGYGISAQLYLANGIKIGPEFIVNSYVKNDQINPKIANLENGNFIILWQSFGVDKDGYGISGQKFCINGTKLDTEFIINSYHKGNQENVEITTTPNQFLMAVWQSAGVDKDDYGISGQFFYSNGTLYDGEFVVNTYTKSDQIKPHIINSDKSTLIVWESKNVDGDGYGIVGQVFDEYNIRLNHDFVVNSITKNDQVNITLTNIFNNYLVSWETISFGSSKQGKISGQVLSSNGTKIDQEFFVDDLSRINIQHSPNVLSSENIFYNNFTNLTYNKSINCHNSSNVIFTWQGIDQEGNTDIYSKINYNFSTITNNNLFSTSSGTASMAEEGSTTAAKLIEQSTFLPTFGETESDSMSTEAINTKTTQIITEISQQTEISPQALSVITTATLSSQTPTSTSTDTKLDAIKIYIDINSVSPFLGTEASEEFIISEEVKNFRIFGGGGDDSFIFVQSSNSSIRIADFSNNTIINLNNFSYIASRGELNITRGSSYINLENNQTIAIENKYPEELQERNFAFSNSSKFNFHSENSNKNSNENADSDNSVYLIAGLSVGSVVAFGALAGGVACCVIYKYKKAIIGVASKIAAKLPFGSNEGDDHVNDPYERDPSPSSPVDMEPAPEVLSSPDFSSVASNIPFGSDDGNALDNFLDSSRSMKMESAFSGSFDSGEYDENI